MTQKNRAAFARARALIEPARRVLCVSPENPDGDSVSSCVAFRLFLEAQGKTAALWCMDPVPLTPVMQSLDGVESFLTAFPSDTEWDLLVGFDYGAVERLHIPDAVLLKVPLLGFDHHVSGSFRAPRGFAVVDPQASSATLLLWKFFRAVRYPLSPEIAHALLVGLCTDTRFFRNALTTQEALRVAGDLMRRGASLQRVNELMSPRYSLHTMEIWRLVLGRLEVRGGRAVIAISYEHRMLWRATKRDIMSAVGAGIEHVRELEVLAVLLEQEEGMWQCALRSPSGTVNVASIAETFGGGGHAGAAGFTTALSRDEIRKRIFEYSL